LKRLRLTSLLLVGLATASSGVLFAGQDIDVTQAASVTSAATALATYEAYNLKIKSQCAKGDNDKKCDSSTIPKTTVSMTGVLGGEVKAIKTQCEQIKCDSTTTANSDAANVCQEGATCDAELAKCSNPSAPATCTEYTKCQASCQQCATTDDGQYNNESKCGGSPGMDYDTAITDAKSAAVKLQKSCISWCKTAVTTYATFVSLTAAGAAASALSSQLNASKNDGSGNANSNTGGGSTTPSPTGTPSPYNTTLDNNNNTSTTPTITPNKKDVANANNSNDVGLNNGVSLSAGSETSTPGSSGGASASIPKKDADKGKAPSVSLGSPTGANRVAGSNDAGSFSEQGLSSDGSSGGLTSLKGITGKQIGKDTDDIFAKIQEGYKRFRKDKGI